MSDARYGAILEVKGTSPSLWWGFAVLVACGLIGVGFSIVVDLAADGELPWFPRSLAQWLQGGEFGIGRVIAVVTGPIAFAVLSARARARSGRAIFYEDRLVLFKPHELGMQEPQDVVTVPWAEVQGFSDASSEFVHLRVKERHSLARSLTIPTPTEADRVAVLALLDRKGIARVED